MYSRSSELLSILVTGVAPDILGMGLPTAEDKEKRA